MLCPAVWLRALVWSASAVQPFLTYFHCSLRLALLPWGICMSVYSSSRQTLSEDRGKVLRLVCLPVADGCLQLLDTGTDECRLVRLTFSTLAASRVQVRLIDSF
jgi:hypothetical protein